MNVKVVPLVIVKLVVTLFVLVQAKGNDIPLSSASTSASITCKDELGNNVDWFIAYKLPKLPQSSDPLFQEGSGYFFILPGNTTWQRSPKAIHHADSILGVTTKPLNTLSNDPDFAFVLYNDQPPNAMAVVRNGHTKGIILANADGGIFLPHSLPHFPIPGQSFGYPLGGLENGQMFFCLSMNSTQINGIGDVLKYTKPNIFKFSIPQNLKTIYPTLLDVAQFNATVKVAPWYRTFPVEVQGLSLTVFAKGPKFRREIYADWISSKYQSGLDVQSWLNGAHPFASNCSSTKYPVLNVLDKTLGGQNFSTHNDHSKWAVGINQQITCIGDLNRMKPQKTRGGIALCIANEKIWNSFKAIVTDTQPCK